MGDIKNKFCTSNFISREETGILFDNMLRLMTDEQLRELFENSKFPTNGDFLAIIDSKANKNDVFDKEYMFDLLEAYFYHDRETASLWIEAERERRANEQKRIADEIQRKQDFACMQERNDEKMAEMDETIEDTIQAKNDMISSVNQKLTQADDKMTEMDERFENKSQELDLTMTQLEKRADDKIDEMESSRVDMTAKIDQKVEDVEFRFSEMMHTDGIGEVIMARDSLDAKIHPNLSARLRYDFNKIESNTLKGGFHQVQTVEDRDDIPQEKRNLGMFCYVEEEDVTYQLKEKDGEQFWEEFSGGAGGMVVETIADRDAIPERKLFVGLEVFVIETMSKYIYKGGGVWNKTSSNSIHIGGEEPLDTTALWIDDEDEDIDTSWDSDFLTEIRNAIKDISSKTDEVHYALTHEIDAGYFNDTLPSDSVPDAQVLTEIEGEEGYTPDLDNGAKGTCERIILKRGLKSDMEALHEGELGFCIDTEELYVGNKGGLRLLAKVGGTSGGSGSSNVTGEYIELIAPNTERYRVKMNNDGEFIIFNSKADTANNPTFDQAPLYKGLVINHCYGGGNINANIAPCSHGFIELYNNSDNTLNLKGLSLQYGELAQPWKVLPLNGIIKPYHSFLVRCAQHTDINRKTCRYKIKKYDMHWDIPLSNNGMKVYLGIGTEQLQVTNPANIDNIWTKQQGYIDLFAFGSTNPAIGIDAYENVDGFIRGGSMLTSVHRKDFVDNDSSFFDLETIQLKTADVKTYMPRCTKDGQWNTYYNKLKLYDHKPNMINICFGKDGNTTRTFTWQSTVTHNGYLKYKKKGATDFITVESEKEIAWHWDTDSTVHRVIVSGLEEGTYVYKCGEEGKWSDEYEFEVKVPTNEDPIKFVFTADQQGINEEEYHVWRKANKVICENEEFDFTINAGDMSNDGGEFGFQWRYYYDFAKDNLCSKPHMSTCGNNDLTPNDVDKKKTDPTAFQWYATYEGTHIPSCYSWNYGYIHFVCLNSNILQASDIVEQQLPWLRTDLAKPENQKRWTIVYMHESPYTIIKQKSMAKFIDVFAEFKVDLVLCGHHHRYSRSHAMLAQNGSLDVVSPNGVGTHYVMTQATGYKLMGKTAPATDATAPWRAKWDAVGNPMFIMWDVTHDSITMRPYTIANILPETDNDFNEPELLPYNDTLVITKPIG